MRHFHLERNGDIGKGPLDNKKKEHKSIPIQKGTDIDYHYMQKAMALAQKAEALGEVPVGCVIVKNDKIIGEGFNQPIGQCDPSAHAEIMALRQAAHTLKNYRLIDTTLYVTLEPCAMCAMAMVHARVKKVVFAADDLKTGAYHSAYHCLVNAKNNHQPDVIHGVLKQEASELLSNFFKKKRKVSR